VSAVHGIEERKIVISQDALLVIVGRALGVDVRGAWIDVCDDGGDDVCDTCGYSQRFEPPALVQLVWPARVVATVAP